MFPKDVLNKIRWTGNRDLTGVEIWVLHRGAPGDRKVIQGGEVRELEHSFFVVVSGAGGQENECLEGQGNGNGSPWEDEGGGGERSERETWIPYHRIQKIFLEKELIYHRKRFRE